MIKVVGELINRMHYLDNEISNIGRCYGHRVFKRW